MKLDIDWTRCDGHGLCAVLLPDRISRDEWGFPLVRGEPLAPAELGAARRTVAACPALALRLTGRRGRTSCATRHTQGEGSQLEPDVAS